MEQAMKPGLRLIDRLLLVGAWLLSCGIVYGLGFYTGSQTQARMPDDEERIVRLPVTAEPSDAGQHTKADDDFTFYDTLVPGAARPRSGETAAGEHPGAEPPAAGKPGASRASGAKTPARKPSGKARAAARTTGSTGGTVRKPATTATVKASGPGARSSKPAAGGTTSTHATSTASKTTPGKAPKQVSATRAATATSPKHPSPRDGAPAGRSRTAAGTGAGERPAVRAAHPRDGVARSAVASE